MDIQHNPFNPRRDGLDPAATLESLTADQHPGLLRGWLARSESEAPTLVIAGGTGRGKTHAAYALANAYRAGDPNPEHLLGRTELAHLTSLTNSRAYYSQGLLEAARLLIVDELGACQSPATLGPAELAALRTLLGRTPGRRLVVTTALSSREIHDLYGDDIISRLAEAVTVVCLEGRDWRAPEGTDHLW